MATRSQSSPAVYTKFNPSSPDFEHSSSNASAIAGGGGASSISALKAEIAAFKDESKRFSNPIKLSDSYKFSHPLMYDTPERKLAGMYGYIEARKGAGYQQVVSAGALKIVHDLAKMCITPENIDEASKLSTTHFGSDKVFDRRPWDVVVNKYHGKLPLKICALPEGTIVPRGTPIVTIESTDPECATLVAHFEGFIQKAIWYQTTVATVSLAFSTVMKRYLNETTSKEVAEGFLPFQHHDFGFRGAASEEAAVIAGVAHLYISKGTDTVPALEYIMKNLGGSMAGFSVPATEHNVMMSRGRAGEFEVLRNVLRIYPTGILSCVADTFDMRNFIESITTGEFRDIIMRRDGKFVIRPDSSFQEDMTTAETISEIFKILGKNLVDVITKNEKGFKVLPPQYGVIYGDGLDVEKVSLILETMKRDGWSTSNIVFGTGGNLVQKGIDRDTLRFAFKCSEQTYVHSDGKIEIIETAKETPGKESKKGRFQVSIVDGNITTLHEGARPDLTNMLEQIYLNGEVTGFALTDTIESIRERINLQRVEGSF